MRKGLIVIFIIAAFLSSCKKTDKPVFDKSPDERINETLAAYLAQLSGAQNGWKGLIKVDSGKGASYSFYFKFNNANRVVMLSDFDSLSAVIPKESSYRLDALQQPSLIFDTYSYLHVLADPNETANGGVRGSGLLSDFEFYFDSTTTDTIKLIGRINGSKLMLVRATQPEGEAYNNGALAVGLSINKILTYFKRLTIGTQSYDIKINPFTRQFTFSWLDANGNLITVSTGYYFIAGGIVFTTPIVNGSQIISGFTDMVWNQASQTITLIAGNTSSTITGIVVPLKLDVAAPARWWNYAITNGNNYWISATGFHVNGVDDAFGIQSLVNGTSGYYGLIYYPQYDTNNDLFAPIFLNAAQDSVLLFYGTAPAKPNFTSDGRAVFSELGEYGTYPTSGPAALSRSLLYNSRGYYFVQTDVTTYDMVSASDGKSWITWQWIF